MWVVDKGGGGGGGLATLDCRTMQQCSSALVLLLLLLLLLLLRWLRRYSTVYESRKMPRGPSPGNSISYSEPAGQCGARQGRVRQGSTG